MLNHTVILLHRGGRSRAYMHKDPALLSGKGGLGYRASVRMGIQNRVSTGFRKTGFFGQNQYDHAYPLLSHDELGHSDQSNDTHHVQLASYMPKRNKGTAPWYRGADTYSPKYAEQGRYEYQRYLMINRYPITYKRDFTRFLSFIRAGRRPSIMAQETLHWVQRMIVDNYNPQHVHYIAAMQTLMKRKEYSMAHEVWQIMERQQTWPCDKTIAVYLDLCLAAKEKTWAFEAWNRYCTEKRFLSEGEVDPKPVTRIPFSLNRDELLHLPKWKKHFDHDPNNDVIDLNRFNTTRVIYAKMAFVMLSANEFELFDSFFTKLEHALTTTPTPVPEPPNPHFTPIPQWAPYETASTVQTGTWAPEGSSNGSSATALGPYSTGPESTISPRFFSNQQYLVHVVESCIVILNRKATRVRNPAAKQAIFDNIDKLASRLKETLGDNMKNLQAEGLVVQLLRTHSLKGHGGKATHALCQRMLAELGETLPVASPSDNSSSRSSSIPLKITNLMYFTILQAFASEARLGSIRSAANTSNNSSASSSSSPQPFAPKQIMQELATVVTEMANDVHVTWSALMHYQIVSTMVDCGTMGANDYFIKNVLRKFAWGSSFLEVLYREYKRAPDVDTWAELTKRALVWTARYNVIVSEPLKKAIEKDYDTIKVQVRTFRELAVFQFRDVEEKRVATDPVNELPNPFTDYVSHALPFPDRDTGAPNEYGDIGQWRAPTADGVTKGPGYYAPPMTGEALKGYTSEWRDPKNPMTPPKFANVWEKKYQEYARGQHPSYDMTYAGPLPEVFPSRTNFRPKTRWDQFDIQKQSKTRMQGPY